MVKDIFAFAMKNSGKEVSTDVCEHFHHTRQELYDIVRVSYINGTIRGKQEMYRLFIKQNYITPSFCCPDALLEPSY